MCNGEGPRTSVFGCIIFEPVGRPLVYPPLDAVTHTIAESRTSDGAARGISSLVQKVLAEHSPIVVIMALHVGLGWFATASGRARVVTMPPIRWTEFVHLLTLALYWLPVLFAIEFWRRRQLMPALHAFAQKYLNARSLLGVVIGSLFVATEARMHALWKQTL